MAEGRNAPILGIVLVVLVVAGVAGFLMFRGPADAPQPSQTAPTVVATDTPHGSASADRTAEPPTLRAPTAEPPSTPDERGRWGPHGESDYKEYVVNGVRVRDHRGGDKPVYTPSIAGSGGAAISPPAARPPPDGRSFPPEVTASIGHLVKDVMRTCAAQIPTDQRAAKPRMLATVTVAVKDKIVTVQNVVTVLADVIEGPANTDARACIEKKAVGLHAPTEEADVTDYDISLSYVL